MQKLIIPFKRAMMLCGYKTASYLAAWGYPHYGIDISSKQGNAGTDDTIYGSGEGTVLAAGKDNSLGYGVAILYKGCECRNGGAKDVVARYMHMSSISVKAGDKVTTATKIGIEGKEGTADYHLHFELDTDTTEKYATWSPQVSKNHTFWVKGTDSTVNPSLYLWQDDEHVLVKPTYNPAWLNDVDKNIPTIETASEAAPLACDDDEDYWGEPAWYYQDKDTEAYFFFDKWYRKVKTETSPSGGRYATAEEKKKLKKWTAGIPEKYKAANDAEGKAGIGESTAKAEHGATAYIEEAIALLEKIKAML